MGGSGELAHVRADLGQDDFGGALVDPGGWCPTAPPWRRRGRSAAGSAPTAPRWSRPGSRRGPGCGRLAARDARRGTGQPGPPAAPAACSGAELLANAASTSGSWVPATRASSIARPETPSTSVATLDSSGPGVLEELDRAAGPPGCALGSGSCGSGPGSRSSRIGRGDLEAGADQPVHRPAGRSRPHRPHRSSAQAHGAGGPHSAASTPPGPPAAARPASNSTQSTPSPPGSPRSWPTTRPAAPARRSWW
jgi:hypothetical protein